METSHDIGDGIQKTPQIPDRGGSMPIAARTAIGAEPGLKIGTVGSAGSQHARRTLAEGGTRGHVLVARPGARQGVGARLGGKARAGTSRQAAAFGEVLLVAVPYSALPRWAALAGLLKGKVVIDTCNPFPSRDGDIANWAREKGAGLASAELLPGARLVRAFNAIGYSTMQSAGQRKGERMGMPIAGDDGAAIAVASRLVREVGYEPCWWGRSRWADICARNPARGRARAGGDSPDRPPRSSKRKAQRAELTRNIPAPTSTAAAANDSVSGSPSNSTPASTPNSGVRKVSTERRAAR